MEGSQPGTVITKQSFITDSKTMKEVLGNLSNDNINFTENSDTIIVNDQESQSKLRNMLSQLQNRSQNLTTNQGISDDQLKNLLLNSSS
jgi:hypothetical protein